MPLECMTHNLQCSPRAIEINILLGEISNIPLCYSATALRSWNLIFFQGR